MSKETIDIVNRLATAQRAFVVLEVVLAIKDYAMALECVEAIEKHLINIKTYIGDKTDGKLHTDSATNSQGQGQPRSKTLQEGSGQSKRKDQKGEKIVKE